MSTGVALSRFDNGKTAVARDLPTPAARVELHLLPGSTSGERPTSSTRATKSGAETPRDLASLIKEAIEGCLSPRSSMLMNFRSRSAPSPSCACVSTAFLRNSRNTRPKTAAAFVASSLQQVERRVCLAGLWKRGHCA